MRRKRKKENEEKVKRVVRRNEPSVGGVVNPDDDVPKAESVCALS